MGSGHSIKRALVTGCLAGMLALAGPASSQPIGPVPSTTPEVPRIGGNIDDYGQWRSPYFFFRMDRSTQMEMPFLDVATAIADSDRALLVVNFYYDGGRYSNYQQAILRRILYYLSSKLPNVEVRLLEVMVASSDGRPIYDKELFKYYANNTLGQYGATIQGQPVMPYAQVYLAGNLVYDFSVMWEATDDDQVMENARAIQSSMLRIAGQAAAMQVPDRKPEESDEPAVREPDLPPEGFGQAPPSKAPPPIAAKPAPAPALKEGPPLPSAAPPAPPVAETPPTAPASPPPAPAMEAAAPAQSAVAPEPGPASTVSPADAEALRRARIKYLEANPPAPAIAETPAATPEQPAAAPAAVEAPAKAPAPPSTAEPQAPQTPNASVAAPSAAEPPEAPEPQAAETAPVPAEPPLAPAEASSAAPAETAPVTPLPAPEEAELRQARARYLEKRQTPEPAPEPPAASEPPAEPDRAAQAATPDAASAAQSAPTTPPAAVSAPPSTFPAPEPPPAAAAPAPTAPNLPKIQPESLRQPPPSATVVPQPETYQAAPADAEAHAIVPPVDEAPNLPDGDSVSSSPDGLPADQIGH